MAREVGDGAAAVSAVPGTDPWIGRVIAGRYRVVDFLAAGGMGRIYRAEQEPLGRLVVLKVLNPRYTASGDDPEFQKRFLLEAATCAKLHHPNVVTIYDYGKVDNDDTYYMAMELVVGRTLGQVLRAEGPMPPRRVIRIARQIGRALREAHHLGIVHRDLKPSNVMLVHTDEGESVKVLDFGLVKVLRDDSEELTMEGKFLGSPKYMSPEQIRHQEVDARSDLYSLGVIMFELLTGKVPFEGTQAVQTLMMHVSLPAPSLRERGAAVPLELDGVVQRCLMKEPEQRFADVDEFMTGLRIAAAALGDDAASFDPLRSTSGFGLS
ncbi:MAG: serine/threonine protein kinase, partial [Deltaproteobacteria bacterium]|nr:serine/threonine protein kinase [Deltaproteobacteria bacterium]